MAVKESTLPIDESVAVPESVKRAAAAAEAFYAKPQDATPPQPAQETPQNTPEVPPSEPVAATPAESPVDQPPPALVPAVEPPPPAPTKEEIHSDSWASRYNAMKGRWEASQRTIGEMQEQLSQLGDELIRTQQVIRSNNTRPPQQTPPKKLITDNDLQQYGPELVDLIKRGAQEAVAPHLASVSQNVQQTTEDLRRQSMRAAKAAIDNALDTSVPGWQEINNSKKFSEWLRLPDIYSGEIRQNLLNAATKAGSAPRVIAFFKGFLDEERATGQIVDPQPAQATPPRQAAVNLASIAAPGKAHPAPGNSAVPADKPTYTHRQIAEFYRLVNAGQFDGRLEDKQRIERDIFAAQNEGRIR